MNQNYVNNEDFYPTPRTLFKKMIKKVESWYDIKTILEPSAGSGTLCDYLKDEFKYNQHEILVIESDPALQKELLLKNYKLIDTDFLNFDSSFQVDLIFANFPFSAGDKHLMKAIDSLYSGEIVAIINAETIKNPYTNLRKELVSLLKKLNADITFLKEEFKNADRKTNVEVALVYINKKQEFQAKSIEEMEIDEDFSKKIDTQYDVATNNKIESLVKLYEKEKKLLTNQIINFYENYNYIGQYLNLEIVGSGDDSRRYSSESSENLTKLVKEKINALNSTLKRKYWEKLINEDEIARKLTTKKKDLIREYIKKLVNFSFNENNIQHFIKNIIEQYSSSIDDSVLELFDDLTKYSLKDYRWPDEELQGNIHYYNGWKTNNAYKVNKKVIIKNYYTSRVITNKSIYDLKDLLHDIDRVIKYFDPNAKDDSIEVLNASFKNNIFKKIPVNSLLFTFYKKGTIHIEFTDEEVLRKFNITVAKLRGELPMDYAEKDFDSMNEKEQKVVNDFEGKEQYSIIKDNKNYLKLTFFE